MSQQAINVIRVVLAIWLAWVSVSVSAQQQEAPVEEQEQSQPEAPTEKSSTPTESQGTIDKIFRPSEDISEDAPVPFPVDI